jgi:hypothetical protein
MRIIRIVVCAFLGFAGGAVIGACCPLILFTYAIVLNRIELQSLDVDRQFIIFWAVFAAPAAVTGAVGGVLGTCLAAPKEWPVAIIPVGVPVVVTLVARLLHDVDWDMFLFLSVLAGLFSWIAGRTAQRLGYTISGVRPRI